MARFRKKYVLALVDMAVVHIASDGSRQYSHKMGNEYHDTNRCTNSRQDSVASKLLLPHPNGISRRCGARCAYDRRFHNNETLAHTYTLCAQSMQNAIASCTDNPVLLRDVPAQDNLTITYAGIHAPLLAMLARVSCEPVSNVNRMCRRELRWRRLSSDA